MLAAHARTPADWMETLHTVQDRNPQCRSAQRLPRQLFSSSFTAYTRMVHEITSLRTLLADKMPSGALDNCPICGQPPGVRSVHLHTCRILLLQLLMCMLHTFVCVQRA